MGRPTMYWSEVRERAVRMVSEHRVDYPSGWAAICSITVAVRVFVGDAAVGGFGRLSGIRVSGPG